MVGTRSAPGGQEVPRSGAWPGIHHGARACLARIVGAPATTRRVHLLVLGAYLIAALSVVLGLVAYWLAGSRSASPYLVAIAVGTVTVSQLALVRVRVGAARLALGWGEAALLVLLYLIPAWWVPFAIFLGVLISMVVLEFFGDRRPVWLMLYNAAAPTVAGGCAALVASLIGEPYRSSLTARVTLALTAGALVYGAIAMVLVTAVACERGGARFSEVAARTFIGKAFMVVGNVTVGLIIVAMLGVGVLWLVALPPVLWLLHQSYAYRMRLDDERRGWRAFSGAIGALNRLDESEVARAAVCGVVRLFMADAAEVLVPQLTGAVRRYSGGHRAAFTVGDHMTGCAGDRATVLAAGEPDPALSAGEPDLLNAAGVPDAPPRPPRCVITRPLLVGGAKVGELRIHFPSPVELSSREHMQLSVFGDALAAALHDAAAHQQLRALFSQSTHEAATDPLTGVPSREALLSGGAATLAGLDREAPVALLVLDINHFKEVNDTLGHVAGDDLIRITARRISAASRAGDLVGRLGGDEFGMLVTDLAADRRRGADADAPASAEPGLGRALLRARELADVLAGSAEVAGVQVAVEASIGVAVAPAACAMTELLRRADIAMYQAKRGGGAVAWYDGVSDVASTDRLTLLAELREALVAQPPQLVLALQPAVDLYTGTPIGLEALIRWQHPRRGELRPTEFMDVLENSELIAPFTRHVLNEALRSAAQCADEGIPLPVSVNLSPRNLLSRGLPNEVGVLLARHNVPPERLILEITETVVVPELRVVTEVLAGLRALGVQLAVDDFGTGYSSLAFLTRVHVDEVKVDRSFVSRMVDSPEAMAIVRATVDLAHRLNLRVVAEGVETAVQKAALTGLGCTAAQGHHFCAPIPAERVVPALQSLIGSAGGKVIPLRAEDAS
jgi:predicted signal transduction protein with EAL and GGDEF domain